MDLLHHDFEATTGSKFTQVQYFEGRYLHSLCAKYVQ